MAAPRTADAISPFEQFLASAPNSVVDAFFSRWTPDLIFKLRPLSSLMFIAVESYRVRTWHPTRVLGRFFHNVPRFLVALDACGGVVSGSQALQLLQRTTYPLAESDLDIFLPYHGLLKMGRWLKRQGYVYQPSNRKHIFFDVETFRLAAAVAHPELKMIGPLRYPPSTGVPSFTTYHFVNTSFSVDGRPPETLRVQLVAVEDPVRYIINCFHSTAVMNYFTGTYAVSLFPWSTFIDRVTYSCKDVEKNRDWSEKYRRRGFEVVLAGDPRDRNGNPDEIEDWDRAVGDSYSWVLPFAPSDMKFDSNVSAAKLPDHKFEVINYLYGVAPSGAYLRVGPPFVYSSLAFVASRVDVTGQYWSAELETAFMI